MHARKRCLIGLRWIPARGKSPTGSGSGDDCGAVTSALQEGVRERDRDHFNRLRLFVVSPSPERIAEAVQAAFSGSPARDEKTHLHVLETRNLGFA